MRMIPSYELYGDLLSGGVPDSVHHETIKERSEKHDWTIRLHRHRRLAQIFLFRSANVYFRLGEIEWRSAEPTVLVIPPGTPHEFRFPNDVVGDVLSIRLDEMPEAIQDRFTQFSVETNRVFHEQETKNFANITNLIKQLGETYHSIGSNRSDILIALVDLIVLYLAGDVQSKSMLGRTELKDRRERQDLKAEAFCTLIEGNFQQAWSVADYANRVGISAPHLTRICRAVLGSSPNELVRQRRILEAKRLLEYTGLSVSEIAHRCGFRDAAFFSRTFKSNVGQPPHIYRQGLDR